MSALIVGIVIAFFARMLVVVCSARSHWVTSARVVGELPPARERAEIAYVWPRAPRPIVEPTAIPGPGIQSKH
jgi:hypothetical protein